MAIPCLVNIDLHKYFDDSRRMSFIYVDKTQIKNIASLKNYIAVTCAVPGPFHLTSVDGRFLSDELDIMFIQQNDTIRVNPGPSGLPMNQNLSAPPMMGFATAPPPPPYSAAVNNNYGPTPHQPVHQNVQMTQQLFSGICCCHQLLVSGEELAIKRCLQKGFRPGSSIFIRGFIQANAERLAFNLYNFKRDCDYLKSDIMLHFNPRFDQRVVVRNTRESIDWGNEERNGGFPFTVDSNFSLRIICEDKGYRIFVNDREFTFYYHRIKPKHVTHVKIKGALAIHSVDYAPKN